MRAPHACIADGERVERDKLFVDASRELGYPKLTKEVRRALNKALHAENNAGRLLTDLDNGEILATIRDLGRHDASSLIEVYREADATPDRPSVIFAYMIKGHRLPIEAHGGYRDPDTPATRPARIGRIGRTCWP